jgi:hypothetical protein
MTDEVAALEARFATSDPDRPLPWTDRSGQNCTWVLTTHARERAAVRNLPLVCVLNTIASYTSAHRLEGGEILYDLSPVAVIANPKTRRVRTVLLCRHAWTTGRWTDADAARLFSALPLPTLPGIFAGTQARRT